jgi:hypothetical protein
MARNELPHASLLVGIAAVFTGILIASTERPIASPTRNVATIDAVTGLSVIVFVTFVGVVRADAGRRL